MLNCVITKTEEFKEVELLKFRQESVRTVTRFHMSSPGSPEPDIGRAKPVQCSQCQDPDPKLIEDVTNGDLICRRCGTVLAERLVDMSTEYRTFADDGGRTGVDPTRIGAATNPLLSEGGLSTIISKGAGMTSDSAALRWQNMGALTQDDNVKKKAFHRILEFADKFSLPGNIKDRACQVFTKYYEARGITFVRGRGLEPLVAACVYIACRMAGVPRAFKEICAVSSSSRALIGRAYNVIKTVLETSLETVTGSDFMNRFCNNLDLDISLTNTAVHASKIIIEKGYTAGRSPISVAAATIYFITQLSSQTRSVKDISKVAGVTEGTIKHAYRDIYPYRAKLLPKDYKLDKIFIRQPESLPPV